MTNSNDINVNLTLKITKKHLAIALIAIAATSLIIPYQIYAQNAVTPRAPSQEGSEDTILNAPNVSAPVQAALTNVIAMPSNSAVSERSWYFLSFVTTTAGTVKKIDVTFPAGFDVSAARFIDKTGIGGSGSVSVTGQMVTYTANAGQSVGAGTRITLMLGDIVNPTIVNNQVSVTTRDASDVIIDGPTNSATFILKKVGTGMISPNAVTSPKIEDSTITTADLADAQITVAKLASNSVDSGRIADGSIISSDIADNAIIGSDISDGTITNNDINGAAAIASSKMNFNPGINMGLGTITDGDGPVTIPDSLRLGSPTTNHQLTVWNDVLFIGQGSTDRARVVFERGTMEVPDTPTHITRFSISSTQIQRVYLGIDCDATLNCRIDGISGSIIANGVVGQILILTKIDDGVGDGGITFFDDTAANMNLGTHPRVLDEPADKLMLIFEDGLWNELSFTDN